MDESPARLHLQKADPILFQAIKHLDLPSRRFDFPVSSHFQRLAEDIVSQQLSVKAASVILARFAVLLQTSKLKHVPAEVASVTPEAVLALPDEQLRGVGLSWAKVKYVKDLAQKTLDNAIGFEHFSDWDDETIVAHLTQVKGIGRWTAEMFLMFTLGRPDIFSAGDLGLKRSMQQVYGLTEAEVTEQAVQLAQRWAPHRTYACLGLWKLLDNLPASTVGKTLEIA